MSIQMLLKNRHIAAYYREAYPCEQLFEFLGASNSPTTREYAIDVARRDVLDEQWSPGCFSAIRYVHVNSGDALRRVLTSQRFNVLRLNIGAVYSCAEPDTIVYSPSDGQQQHGASDTKTPGGVSRITRQMYQKLAATSEYTLDGKRFHNCQHADAVECEFRGDFDVKDLDSGPAIPSARSCQCTGNAMCRACWSVLTMQAQCLDLALQYCGVERESASWFYSGNRGYHVWAYRGFNEDRRMHSTVLSPMAAAIVDASAKTSTERLSAAERAGYSTPHRQGPSRSASMCCVRMYEESDRRALREMLAPPQECQRSVVAHAMETYSRGSNIGSLDEMIVRIGAVDQFFSKKYAFGTHRNAALEALSRARCSDISDDGSDNGETQHSEISSAAMDAIDREERQKAAASAASIVVDALPTQASTVQGAIDASGISPVPSLSIAMDTSISSVKVPVFEHGEHMQPIARPLGSMSRYERRLFSDEIAAIKRAKKISSDWSDCEEGEDVDDEDEEGCGSDKDGYDKQGEYDASYIIDRSKKKTGLRCKRTIEEESGDDILRRALSIVDDFADLPFASRCSGDDCADSGYGTTRHDEENMSRDVTTVLLAACSVLFPRLDGPVTDNMKHLLKAPMAAHPSTGKISIPIRRETLAIGEFYPMAGKESKETGLYEATPIPMVVAPYQSSGEPSNTIGSFPRFAPALSPSCIPVTFDMLNVREFSDAITLFEKIAKGADY